MRNIAPGDGLRKAFSLRRDQWPAFLDASTCEPTECPDLLDALLGLSVNGSGVTIALAMVYMTKTFLVPAHFVCIRPYGSRINDAKGRAGRVARRATAVGQDWR
jgi:hypothetical protein